MTTVENIQSLEERQVALEAIMRKSDAHASKCAKMGLKYKTQYPDEYAAYEAAWKEYNANETTLETLRQEAAEEAEAEAVIMEEG